MQRKFLQPNSNICGQPTIIPKMIDLNYYGPSGRSRRQTEIKRSTGFSNRSQRIYKGHLADGKMHPWLVLIRSTTDMCGGSIISNNFVLTAAHCCWDNLLDMAVDRTHLIVYAGMGSRLDDWRYNSNIQRKLVSKVIIHHTWINNIRTRVEVENDIAILKTKSPFKFDAPNQFGAVRPICLPNSVENSNLILGDQCWIAGFGATAGTNQDPLTGDYQDETKLRHTDIHIIDSYVCQNNLNSEILNSQICAGDLRNGADSCRGDSGGPLICAVDRNDPSTYAVEGIVSWGKECGRENSPGVYGLGCSSMLIFRIILY